MTTIYLCYDNNTGEWILSEANWAVVQEHGFWSTRGVEGHILHEFVLRASKYNLEVTLLVK